MYATRVPSVSVRPGVTTVTVGGESIALTDWVDRDHWGTVDFTARARSSPLDAFGYMQSQAVAGASRYATLADTSIPRAGWAGLPQGHRFLVFAWRAVAIAPSNVVRCDAAQSFFATTMVQFIYNDRVRAESTLADLLRIVVLPSPQDETPGAVPPQPFAGVGQAVHPRQQHPVAVHNPPPMAPDKPHTGRVFTLAIDIREHLAFECRVRPQCEISWDALAITLGHVGTDMSVRIFLSGLYQTPVS